MVQDVLAGDEQAALKDLVADPKSVGHAILSNDGEPLFESGLSDMAVPVAANMFDVANQIGDLLGETSGCRRYCVVGSGRSYMGVRFSTASALIVQSTSPKAEIKELRDVR